MANKRSKADPLAKLKAERGRFYGHPLDCHANIGLGWTGQLQQHYGIKLDHPIPGWIVSQMLVIFKQARAARAYRADNFRDAQAYNDFAREGQRRDPRARLRRPKP